MNFWFAENEIYRRRKQTSLTGCAVAQHCYNCDISFLLGKMETLTPCNIEILEQSMNLGFNVNGH